MKEKKTQYNVIGTKDTGNRWDRWDKAVSPVRCRWCLTACYHHRVKLCNQFLKEQTAKTK